MKKILRKKILQKRELLTKKEIREKSEIITNILLASEEYRNSQSFFCFLSFGSEVDTDAILKDALKTKKVYVPFINKKDDLMYPVLINRLSDFKVNKFGIREPDFLEAAILPKEFDLSLVPGLAFDKRGWRIGYGKGYYDKFFCKYKVRNKIAIAFSLQLINKIPFEEHDISVDRIITEDEIIQV